METVYGNRYQRNQDIVKIAKLVRQDIKEAVSNGRLPNAKYSVRTKRYAGGQSMLVEVLDAGLPTWNYIDRDCAGNQVRRAVNDRVENLMAAYNYDGSDSQTDYFHVNFYTHVYIPG